MATSKEWQTAGSQNKCWSECHQEDEEWNILMALIQDDQILKTKEWDTFTSDV
jgi:hypothetical protein